jgi:hypothetical protein
MTDAGLIFADAEAVIRDQIRVAAARPGGNAERTRDEVLRWTCRAWLERHCR